MSGVQVWWIVLGAASAINVLGWLWTASALHRHREVFGPHHVRLRRQQLALSAVYVLGCAWRSAFPLFDVPRVCLFDAWTSTVIVGRSVATLAELAFVAQWVLLLREVGRAARSRIGPVAAAAVFGMIVVAETFSWYAVLTRSNFGHVVEESLWGASAVAIVVYLLALWPQCDARLRVLIGAIGAAGLAYIAFMFIVDVPMYWSRWSAELARGQAPLDIADGILDAARPCTVSFDWSHWRAEIPWMSMYFTVAVWVSIGFVHIPLLEPRDGVTRRGLPRVGLRPWGRYPSARVAGA
ncbi:MAG: hypothetical protein R3E48_00660 [Burkholderiaceae bacterium]